MSDIIKDGDETTTLAITRAIIQVGGSQAWAVLSPDMRRAFACKELLSMISYTKISDHGGMGPTPYYDRWVARSEHLLHVHDFSQVDDVVPEERPQHSEFMLTTEQAAGLNNQLLRHTVENLAAIGVTSGEDLTKRREKAVKEGRAAFGDDKTVNANPYEHGTAESDDWRESWMGARDDAHGGPDDG